MKVFTVLLIGSLLLTPTLAEAQRPTRRAILEQGAQILEDAKQVKLQNQVDAGITKYIEREFPLLNYAFEKPKREDEKPDPWEVHVRESNTSEYSRYDISDGDYIALEETQHPETYVIFIYSKDFDGPTTIETVKQEWADEQRQPDHDNVFEYSNLGFIRELNVIRTDDYEYMGQPALFIEYTFNNWSKFWHETVVMFPYGNKIYTIKYRRERDEEDKFYDVFQHVLDSFRFLRTQPDTTVERSAFSDVATNHKHARAITRMKDLGIVGGYSDGSFKPGANINRAEFVKIMASEPLISADELGACDISTLTFSDVPADAWYAPHVCVAVARGMIGGYPDGTFRGSNSISFAEAAKIIATFFSEEGISQGEGQWYQPFIAFLAGKRAIPLSVDAPGTLVRRDIMSEILYRLYDRVTSEESKSADDF